MNIIWATRGRTWGFRFLRTAGLTEPLETYERAFAGTEGAPETFTQRAGMLAVRFPDPDGRTDRAGRVIPHEFILLSPDDTAFVNADAARAGLWREVREHYAEIWDHPSPPLSAHRDGRDH